MHKKFCQAAFGLALLFCFTASAFVSLDPNRLSDNDIKMVENLLAKLAPLIKQHDDKKNLATLTFDELYGPLDPNQSSFLKSFQNLNAKDLNVKIPFRGIATGKEKLVTITGQNIKIKGEPNELPPQFLPPQIYKSYLAMMHAMQKDIGKRLYVESGYRSSAYQLYLFIFYLKNHDYSIRETVKFVALPGYSEHGAPAYQAIDFIDINGTNGEQNPKDFEDLPEFAWLQANAAKFDFVLSYPKDSQDGITYEPWHWRYERQANKQSAH
jgi:hypothetical protein